MAKRSWTRHSTATKYIAATVLAVCSSGCQAAPNPERSAEERYQPEFSIEPYLWLPSFKGDVPDGESNSVNVDFIGLDDLEYALMFALELGVSDVDISLLLDSIFLRFDGEGRFLAAEIETRFLETLLAYHPTAWHGLQLLAGARYWDLGIDLDLTSAAGLAREEAWVDPILGLRGSYAANNSWSFHGRADTGGFGLGADRAYQLSAETRWSFSEHGGLELGYRYLFVDFDDREIELTLAGPLIALRFSL